MTLYARLDKTTEKRVLCGLQDCRGELARVEEPATSPGECPRKVWFGPGWEPRADGVWASTRRAAMKVRRGQLQHNRPGKPTRRHGGWRNGGELSGWLPYNLPVQAKCPVCGQVQTLDPGVLHVSAHEVDLSRPIPDEGPWHRRRTSDLPGRIYAPPEHSA